MSNATKSNPNEDLAAMVRKLREENERLTAALTKKANGQVTIKASEKGGISVYGLGRFPVTLYAFGKESGKMEDGQWSKLFAQKDAVMAFAREHEQELKRRRAAQDASERTVDNAVKNGTVKAL